MDKKRNRSVRLKKYEAVYNEYLKNKSKSPVQKQQVHIVEHKKSEKKISDSTKGRKKLTEYQKFVKEQSKREKYKGLKPEERLAKIARSWKKHSLKRTLQSRKNDKPTT
jgi:sugar diacid utilization regulator